MSSDSGGWDCAEFLALPICIPANRPRNGKAKAFASAARRIDKGIDSTQAPVAIHERAAAVARIDRCVGLHVDHGAVGVRLPAERADYSLGHSMNEPLR